MAKQVFSDVTMVVGIDELSTLTNEFSIDQQAESLESTNFGSDGWREVVGGERAMNAMFRGFIADDSGSILTNLRDHGNNTADVPIIVTDTNAAAAGDDAVLMEKGLITDITEGGEVNQIATFDVEISSEGVGGYGQYGGTETSVSASGTTTGLNLGQVGANQKLLSILSVNAAATGTLDVLVESDGDNTFAAATTRITHTQVTTSTTSEALTADGAITDTWYRFNYTIASSGVYSFRVALAIVNV